MMVNDNAGDLVTARPRWLKRDVKGLLWKEWLEHGGLLTAFLSVWLVCGWVLLIFNHPGWLLAFGICYTLLAGPAFGGAGASEGSEEFSFSLPPTRGKQYFARLAAGGAPLVLFLALGLLAVGLDLPQLVWRLFVESGLTEPFPGAEQSFLYALALTFPLAVFALAFAFAALATSRPGVAWSGVLAAIIIAVLLGAGLLCESLLWGRPNGYVSSPGLLAVAAIALHAGYVRYGIKEGVSRPLSNAGASAGWIWWLVVIVVILILLSGFFLTFRGQADRSVAVRERARAEAERIRARAETERAEVQRRVAEQERARAKTERITTTIPRLKRLEKGPELLPETARPPEAQIVPSDREGLPGTEPEVQGPDSGAQAPD